VRSAAAAVTALLLLVPGARAAAGQQPQSPRQMVEEAERHQYENGNKTTITLARRALALLTRPEDVPLRMRALRLECWGAAEELEGPALARLADRGLAEAERAGDARMAADLRLCRGYASEASGEMAKAMDDYAAALAEAGRLRDDTLQALGTLLRGEARYDRGEFAAALVDLKQAYEAYVRLGIPSRQRYTLNAIANLYADPGVGEYDRALEYYRQLMAADAAAGLTPELSTAYYNIGATLESKGDPAAALPYYQRSLRIEMKRGDAAEIASVEQAIGVALAKLGRSAQALSWLDRALAYAVRSGEADREQRIRLSRAVALRGLGRPRDALGELDGPAAYFQAQDNPRYLEKIHAERAMDLAALGDWAGAYRERDAQMAQQQKLAAQLKAEQTSRLRVQFDTEKMEADNRALTRENQLRGKALADAARIRRLQTWVLILALLALCALALLVARHVAAARTMRSLAMTDDLTRLPNRRHLMALAQAAVREARRTGQPFSVVALDVDRFKSINDTYGHDVGDEVLRRVSAACRGALRQSDALGRVGGEEFIAILPGTPRGVAAEVGERLRAAVERVDWSAVDARLAVTISVGVAERAPHDAFADVARRADDSLYRAKEHGRNRVELAPA
jgi:diguanylate cyclase (GGDEF)-like protein